MLKYLILQSKNLDRNNEAVLKEKLVLCEENIKKLKEKITKMEEVRIFIN